MHSDSAVRLVVLHVSLLETKKVKYMFSFSVLGVQATPYVYNLICS